MRSLFHLLREREIRLCTVESCTGGRIASRLTAVPGSSDVFWGGFVTYAESAKTRLVGVPEALLASHGAVSAEVAAAMAEGGLSALQAAELATGKKHFLSLSITGIAGPGGVSAEKPIGLCFIGLAAAGFSTVTKRFLADVPAGSEAREQLQELFTEQALAFLESRIETLFGRPLA